MNTSIHGMKRTDWCGELRAADAGREVVLNGWCDRTQIGRASCRERV